MAIKVAINGFGRIGRCTLRAIYEQGLQNEFEVVAINASGDLATNAHLLKYDTTHGRFTTSVETEGENCIVIDGKKIAFYSTKDPKGVNWADHGVDVLLECTGAYTTKAKAQALLEQGAKRVLISAPGGDDVDTTIVMGVNENALTAGMTVVSNASCTTNCLAPVAKILSDNIGIKSGLMTTVHAYTNDQVTVDVRHKDLRRARAAAANIIPTKTGAAKAVGLVLPQLVGKFDGFALRVPTINVLAGRPDLHRRARNHQGRNQRADDRRRQRSAQGRDGRQHRAAGLLRLQPHHRLLDLRRDPDPRAEG